ncbi:MAG: endonuclease/exonuclease/phosphatase family protein [Deltaproteobacteria bacterium]|nr:endonuclease/exonuclease/phosphatase family protein [Deltaproteobacteria bacterium]
MRRAVLLSMLLGLVACATEPSAPAGVVGDAGPLADTPADTPADTLADAARLAPPAPDAVRVVAFNVRRLFDEACDTGRCGGPDDYEATATAAQIDERTDTIAGALASLRADVLLLEEIETAPLLDEIADRMPGGAWSRVLGEIGDPGSVDVGVASVFPIKSVKRHRDRVLTRPDGSLTNFAREFLEVHLDVRGAEAVVFVAHFRSKASDDPGRRLAEAQGARDIVGGVAAAQPDALVLLGGDLNDEPDSPPLRALEEGGALLRVSAGLPQDAIGTFTYGGKLQAIDHFYLAKGNLSRYVRETFRTLRDPGARGLAGSDHAAIVADYSGFPPRT